MGCNKPHESLNFFDHKEFFKIKNLILKMLIRPKFHY